MQSIIPKREIGALDFLQKYPEYDGRGTVIAIWDTGVDPTAKGLQVTSDGKPKILDFIDAGGSGDVRMLETFKITSTARSFTTLTGRKVTIPQSWKPVDGLVRVGAKPAFEIFPKILMERVKEQFKSRQWNPVTHQLSFLLKEASKLRPPEPRAAETENEDGLNIRQEDHVSIDVALTRGEDYKLEPDSDAEASFLTCNTPSVNGEGSGPVTAISTPRSPVEELPRSTSARGGFNSVTDWLKCLDPSFRQQSIQDLEKFLSSLDNDNEFFCPVYDCFLFRGEDGDFVCCVDTSPYEDGETGRSLIDLPLMKDFTIGRQVASLGNETLLYYTVKILDEGNLMQIVTNSGSHATHVASIAAGYYPDNGPIHCPSPELSANQNGIAPGAQIVSIKISDTHLQGMETNTALLRAINWTRDYRCDIVNYSFGEQSYLPGFGRIYQHLTQFVMETNTCFVTSGGNNGPSLGTIGSPGSTVDGLISVAPLVFPNMMEYIYCQPTCCQQFKKPPSTEKEDATDDNEDGQCNEGEDGGRIACVDTSCPVASTYTWGSRGPASDGSLGLMVSAAGGAIADMAAWEYLASGLKNGSSMSSPAVAGAISLVISGVRRKLGTNQTTPPSLLMRAAILRSSRPIKHLSLLDQGAGVFHVESTFDFLVSCIESPPNSLSRELQSIKLEGKAANVGTNLLATGGWFLDTRVIGPGCVVDNKSGVKSRGVWLRRGWLPLVRNCDPSTVIPEMTFTIILNPTFSKDVSVVFKRNFAFNLAVTVDDGRVDESVDLSKPTSRPAWLKLAPYAMVTNREKTILLTIDPNSFDGEEKTADIRGPHPPSRITCTQISFVNLDSANHEVVAQVPITIQIPRETFFDYANGVHRFNLAGEFNYKQKVCRWFVRIPSGSTAGVLYLRRCDADGGFCCFDVTVVVPLSLGATIGTGNGWNWHQIPLLSPSAGGVGSSAKMLRFDPTTGYSWFPFPIAWAGDTVEVTVAQYWGAQSPSCSLEGSLTFRGLEIEPRRLSLHSAQNHLNVNLRSHFGLEQIEWDFKMKHFVLPLKPTSHQTYFEPLNCSTDKQHAISRFHVLRLEYKFACPFKSVTTFLSMRRLTSVLYDANILEVVYHVLDACGRYRGAGSYQNDESPKYTFTLLKGNYTVVVRIITLEGKKSPYASPGDLSDYNMLEKLKTYPLLVYFRLAGNDSQPISSGGSFNGRPQLGLEVASSLATLGLYGADFAKSYSALHHTTPSLSVGSEQSMGDVEQAGDVPPGKGGFMTSRVFPTVPHLLTAGETFSTVLGIIHENFAPYAIPGSYFEGQLKYYGNKELNDIATAPFEVIVGANQNATSTQSVSSHTKLATNINPIELQCLVPLVKAFFSSNKTTELCSWTSVFLQGSGKSPATVNSSGQKSRRATKSHSKSTSNDKSSPTSDSASWTEFLDALHSAATSGTSNFDREAVWSEVNSAMTHLVEFAKESSSVVAAVCLPVHSLLPTAYEGGNPLNIPLLYPPPKDTVPHIVPNQDAKKKENTSADDKSSNSTDADTVPSLSKSSAIECLATYGRFLAERLLQLSSGSGQVDELASLDFAFRLLLIRLSGLMPQKSPDTPSSKVTVAVDPLSCLPIRLKFHDSGPERQRAAYFACFLAHLFVYHSDAQLLLHLLCIIRNDFQEVDEHSSKQAKHGFDKTAMDCASLVAPWMISQLHRMGLSRLADLLERQLPARYVPYQCFERKLTSPNPPAGLPSGSNRNASESNKPVSF